MASKSSARLGRMEPDEAVPPPSLMAAPVGAGHEDGKDGRLRPPVVPAMTGAVLHDGVAWSERDLGTVVELEHELTREHDLEVDRVGGVHARIFRLHVLQHAR